MKCGVADVVQRDPIGSRGHSSFNVVGRLTRHTESFVSVFRSKTTCAKSHGADHTPRTGTRSQPLAINGIRFPLALPNKKPESFVK